MAAQFTSLTAVAAPYEGVNVDTDQIVPARFLKVARGAGYGRLLFHDLRFFEDGTENPAFVLNREPYRTAQILVADANFGCGSSREAAAYALYDQGFRSVIAPSFGDIFFGNCLQNGIVPARLPEATCARLRRMLAERPGTRLTVDLGRLRVTEEDATAHEFSVGAFFREMLLQGTDEVGLTLSLVNEIEAFERAYAAEAPWSVR
ncbi:MAG TPA: 3-isopropylmalate dehydratase small subunit [Burkholderiales bacterium]|nr:3-isopropylmalate dehydratase small subunit [Burkholderiales bacterium]